MIALLLLFLCAPALTHAQPVYKKVLDNGLTVLVRPTQLPQKVSTQLCINVGSKHEETGQRGLAHWLEHMFFKGTSTMSETDIPATTAKLSGSFNAATSYDKTYFYIDLPVQHWQEALPMLADGMCNCTFKEDLINAEVQVVIQELKMYKDHPTRSIFNATMAANFYDHPYHYPVIGYKNDLKKLTRDDLVAFYKKYYVPSNAAVVIVGNVDIQEAFDAVERYFGAIAYAEKPACSEHVHQEDLVRNTTTLYRNVQQPLVTISYTIPGFAQCDPAVADICSALLGASRNALLVKRLVHELQLVNWIYATTHDLFDYGIFSVNFEPKKPKDCPKIIALIQKEIDAVAAGNFNKDLLDATIKKMRFDQCSFLENNHAQATAIGHSYLGRHDENFFFKQFLFDNISEVSDKLEHFAGTYLRPTVMHKGFVMPIPEREKKFWNKLQHTSNREDAEILANKQRQSSIELPVYAQTVHARKPALPPLACPQTITLDNGVTVLYYHNPALNKIDLSLVLKASSHHQDNTIPGGFNLLCDVLEEGTKKYSQEQLDDELSKHCIGLHVNDGTIRMSMLAQDFPKAFKILEEVVVRPTLKKEGIDKIKSSAIATLRRSQNDAQVALERLMQSHLFGKQYVTEQHIKSLTQHNLKKLYTQFFSPDGALLVIVGNLENYDIPALMHATIGRWQGPAVADMQWPQLTADTDAPTALFMNNEQVMLGLAAPSVSRTHPDYYKLLLFDIVLHEKLFNLRSQSGAFYAFDGSVIHGSNQQAGIAKVTVNVSQTRVDEVEALLRRALPHLIASFDEHDLAKAKLELLNSTIEGYATNSAIMHQFIGLYKNNLPFDYYAQRNAAVENVSVAEVQNAVAHVLDPEKLVTFRVGNVHIH